MNCSARQKKKATGKSVIYIVLLLLMGSGPAHADLTVVGDAAIMAKLAEMVKQGREQVAQARDMISITKRLEEMEQLKSIRSLSKEGEVILKLLNDAQTIQNNASRWYDDPFGTKSITRDVDRLTTQLSNANRVGSLQQAKTIAHLLSDAKRLSWLGKMHFESLQRVTKNSNDSDHHAITASSQLIVANILLANQQRSIAKEIREAEILQTILKSIRYKDIANRW